jgi:soluble lytic murein transglycosylase-like protein
MKFPPIARPALATLAVLATTCIPAHAAEHVTLRNGSAFDCIRQEPSGANIRLYLLSTSASSAEEANYIEIPAASILRTEIVPDPPATNTGAPHLASEMWVQNPNAVSASKQATAPLTPAEMRQLLTSAGTLHNIDADLLASIVKAESNGNALAVSRTGARGLMQLMPGTASDLGVRNSFAPDQNIGGGTAYLDQLLTRYHNDIALAVAAYNAGPAAVDRYHGIPPYRETRAYVARVIREFNRRKLAPTAADTH